MVFRTVVGPKGTIELGPAASQRFEPGELVEVVLASTGIIMICPDSGPPELEASFRPLEGGAAQLAQRRLSGP